MSKRSRRTNADPPADDRKEFLRDNAVVHVEELEERISRYKKEITEHLKSKKSLRRELGKLTAALHAVKAHPDYQYIVVPPEIDATCRRRWIVTGGWKRCQEAEITLAPGDECYRRRIDALFRIS